MPLDEGVHAELDVPADAVVPEVAAAWGAAALAGLDEHGLPEPGLDPALVEEVLPRVRAELAAEPVEDLRVDAEDGYRGPPDGEDDDVRRAAEAVAGGLAAGAARRRPRRPRPARRPRRAGRRSSCRRVIPPPAGPYHPLVMAR